MHTEPAVGARTSRAARRVLAAFIGGFVGSMTAGFLLGYLVVTDQDLAAGIAGAGLGLFFSWAVSHFAGTIAVIARGRRRKEQL